MVLVGILTINGSQTEQISFLGTYSQDGFALAQDITGVGGADVMWSPTTESVSGLDSNGNAVEGQQITATLGNQNLQNVTYTWLVGGQVVQGGIPATATRRPWPIKARRSMCSRVSPTPTTRQPILSRRLPAPCKAMRHHPRSRLTLCPLPTRAFRPVPDHEQPNGDVLGNDI